MFFLFFFFLTKTSQTVCCTHHVWHCCLSVIVSLAFSPTTNSCLNPGLRRRRRISWVFRHSLSHSPPNQPANPHRWRQQNLFAAQGRERLIISEEELPSTLLPHTLSLSFSYHKNFFLSEYLELDREEGVSFFNIIWKTSSLNKIFPIYSQVAFLFQFVFWISFLCWS